MFLQTASYSDLALGSGLLALGAGIFIGILALVVALYIFTSFAFMRIGQKAKVSIPGLAWIPGIGPALIAFMASGMHWWPWLLLIGFVIPVVSFFAQIIFTIYSIAWVWKTMEKIGRPGWWAILIALIPIVNLILIGMAAWGSSNQSKKRR
ncbi:MAG: hypothetical protein ACP5D2_03655 [Candidatus Nanoarchaeia archaeon]